MKDYDFFPGEGKFYKANLHCHTVISDGKLTKEQIKEAVPEKRLFHRGVHRLTGLMATIRS
ncbi:MAG: hypothetical protein ACLR2E_18330 [Lachnospiraceae bacterium]